MEFFSFILQSHSFKYRQVDRQVLSALIVLKIYFEEKKTKQFMKNECFTNF